LLCIFVAGGVFASCRDIRLNGDVNQTSLWSDLSQLAADEMQGRRAGTEGASRARDYITSRFKGIGLHVFDKHANYQQTFTHPLLLSEFNGVNLFGWLPGSDNVDKFIVVSAHYDHIGGSGKRIFNGADDNASGVAAMLALAEVLQKKGSRNSIIFLATDAEEKGLYGAKEFVLNPPVPIDKIKYNLNLDMLAQGGSRKKLYVSGARQFPEFKPIIKKVISESGLCLADGHRRESSQFGGQKSVSWSKASDHAAFASKGIPYLYVGVDVHPDYHTIHDEVDRIDPIFYTAAVETALNLLRHMDEL
jgi:Zn-dependent M28 family amino/carboxypeptidase